jgi:lysophospholipase L1-like esterase
MDKISHRHLWKKLALAVFSFLITFMFLEFAARIFIPLKIAVKLRDGIYVNSLPLVTGLLPSAFHNKREGEPLSEDKPDGEIRIFVYGESSVEGVPLDLNASSPTMLYDLIKETKSGLNIKVINMAHTGSISANTYYYLLATRFYHPDFVIFYMGINDRSGMSGEECWPVSHPYFHPVWRLAAEHSFLFWAVRVFGPALVWKDESFKNAEMDCPAASFPMWTDILTQTATAMGARVIITTPLRSAVAVIEPKIKSMKSVPSDLIQRKDQQEQKSTDTMTDSYRQLLICRFTEGCDFTRSFMEYVSDDLMNDHNFLLSSISDAWKKSADRFGADFIDFRSELESISPYGILADNYFVDEIHLSLEGYNFLARFWKESLMKKLTGVSPKKPEMPSFADVQQYRDASRVTGTSMMMNYFKRGWYLTIIPGLRFASERCPGGNCDKLAALALGWLRHKAGLDPKLPADLVPRMKTFDPANPLF